MAALSLSDLGGVRLADSIHGSFFRYPHGIHGQWHPFRLAETIWHYSPRYSELRYSEILAITRLPRSQNYFAI